MTKVLSFFNHKGGVSKTTTSFNLGWEIANKGKKVLMVDCDPQCNLTGMVLGFTDSNDYNRFYAKNQNSNVHSCIAPALAGMPKSILNPEGIDTLNPNLKLLAGHINLSMSEAQFSVSLSASNSLTALQNIPGVINELVRMAAIHGNYDLVIIDMSPSVGAFNQCVLMSSDYFIIPTFPDYYCDQAIRNLRDILPQWNHTAQLFRGAGIERPFPKNPPKFIGTVSQRYRPRSGFPAASFQNWITQIKNTVNVELLPALQASGMTISEQQFRLSEPQDEPFNIANIADFNSLIAQSQKHRVPIYDLSDDQIEKDGAVLKTMQESRKNFKEVFGKFANSVITLTEI
jgi:cellulose biosynthesis protein BcsQ